MKVNDSVLGLVFSVMAVFVLYRMACNEIDADLRQFVSLSVELHSVTYHNLNVDHHVNFKSCFHSCK